MSKRNVALTKAEKALANKGFDVATVNMNKYDHLIVTRDGSFVSTAPINIVLAALQWTDFSAKLHTAPKDGVVQLRVFEK